MDQDDLFGAPTTADRNTPVRIELHFHRQSDKAFLLSKTGRNRDAQWIPKSRATRDHLVPSYFTLTRADALERNWL